MDNTKLDIALNSPRSEEVQHIIDRMPTKVGVWICGIITIIFLSLIGFGWVIKYPDVVIGQITINSNGAPLKLVSNVNGRLKLLQKKSLNTIKAGEVIGYIENSSDYNAVGNLKSLLSHYNPSEEKILELIPRLPSAISLGELNRPFSTFSNALQQYRNHLRDQLMIKQGEGIKLLMSEQTKAMQAAAKRIEMSKENLLYAKKFYMRDSVLLKKKVISEAELDKSRLSYLAVNDDYQNAMQNLISSRRELQQNQSRLQELEISKPEKETELKMALVSAYNDLTDGITSWEQKYVFKAPFKGRIQFLKFFTQDQFVTQGEQLFTLVPEELFNSGHVLLPANGAGKIKVNQEVIIKLDNFPYMEFGTITGRVSTISLTAGTSKLDKDEVETYLVLIDLPKKIKTNYGEALNVRPESKGTAEIITKDRRLIERLFENLKYIANKK